VAVIASCIAFWYLIKHTHRPPLITYVVVGILTVLACIEKLSTIMNTVAVERDWVCLSSSRLEYG